MFLQKILFQTQELFDKFKPKGRYRFIMIDHANHIVLDERFFTKIRAVGCLDFHTRLTAQFKYRLIDTKTGEEITHV